MRRGNIEPVKLNIGCGLAPAHGYVNLDNSPSLSVQNNLPLRICTGVIEQLLRRRLYTRFPKGVKRQDVTQGLPYGNETVSVVYSSHMLEHLPRQQAEEFLRDVYRVLTPGGILRLALPDLESKAREYLSLLDQARQGELAAIPADEFMSSTQLGLRSRGRISRPREYFRMVLARERHLWMWDAPSLFAVLKHIGFVQISQRHFRESGIPEVSLLDLENRKSDSFYTEACK